MDKRNLSLSAKQNRTLISVAVSAIILSGCATTGGTGSAENQKPLDPPSSLTPLPPPGFQGQSRNPPAEVVTLQPVTAPDSAELLPQASAIEPETLPVAESLETIAAELKALTGQPVDATPVTSSPSSRQVATPDFAPSDNQSVTLNTPAVTAPGLSSPGILPSPSPSPSVTTDTPTGDTAWINRFPALAQEYEEFRDIQARLEQAYRRYEQKVNELRKKASQIWGDGNVHESSRDKYVKYGEGYDSRGEVDFVQGKVLVETIVENNHQQRLKDAIVATLLTPDDIRDPELFSDQAVTWKGPAVLAGQIRDHDGVIVQWEWRAKRYADWLVANKLQRIPSGGRTLYRIEIPMEENHQQVRGQKYENLVRQAAQRYSVPESLIYSIMETESHFNPYATSHIPAYGLMQVVPSTAGADVFQRIKKKSGQPTRSYLFNPANNIDTGAAYLSILDDIYLKGVTHPLSREYCVISAYNGGAGNVLRTFSRDRKHAVQVINSLSPQQVYLKLNKDHPSSESRRYIEKVVKAKQKYDGMAVAQH